MGKVLALVLLVAACKSDEPSGPGIERQVGELVVEMCGEAPNAPGYGVSSSNGTVTMSTADYNAINAWRDQVTAWRSCVVDLSLVVLTTD